MDQHITSQHSIQYSKQTVAQPPPQPPHSQAAVTQAAIQQAAHGGRHGADSFDQRTQTGPQALTAGCAGKPHYNGRYSSAQTTCTPAVA